MPDSHQADRVHLASDLHLGAPGPKESRRRETAFVSWLLGVVEGRFEGLEGPATEIHLVGDMFDFWFEYKRAIPKGGVRLLGAIASVTDAGIPVHYHVGNHDLWTFGYLESELGVHVHRSPKRFSYNGLDYLIGHGDGLGPGDQGYKRLKRIFTHPVLQRAFQALHPDVGMRIAQGLSSNSRAANAVADAQYNGPSSEWLWQYCRDQQEQDGLAAFIFGHRHLPLDLPLWIDSGGERNPGARYINLGDWIHHFTALRIEGAHATLDQYDISSGLAARVGPWRPKK